MNTNPSRGSLLGFLDLERMRSRLEEHKGRVAAAIMECIHGYNWWDLTLIFMLSLIFMMASVGPYEMASTYGFSPLAIAATDATMDVIDGENLVERAVHVGSLWREIVESWHHPLVNYVAQIGPT